jgi:septal ring factor EnvC (AmiA/AmiB activator)
VSEQTDTAVAGEHTEQGQEAPKSFEAITSQEDFDKAIQARIARERAKIPADYEELKAQAAKFQEFQESQKTEAEKTAERLAAAEKRAVELEAKATRAEVAAAKGVPVGLLSGSTQAELEASADALIQFKGESGGKPLHVPNEGKSPTAQVNGKSEFAKNLFRRGD